jgi:hypothetical protein
MEKFYKVTAETIDKINIFSLSQIRWNLDNIELLSFEFIYNSNYLVGP